MMPRQYARHHTLERSAAAAKALEQSVTVLIAGPLAVFLAVTPLGAFADLPPALVVHGTAFALLALFWYALSRARRAGGNPWLDPASLLCGLFFIRYGLGSLIVYYYDQIPWVALPHLKSTFLRDGTKDNLPKACQLFLLAGAGLFMGTRLPVRFSDLLPALRWPVQRGYFQRCIVLYVPIALVLLVVLAPLTPELTRNIVFLLGSFSWVATVLVSYWAFQEPSCIRWKWLLAAGAIWASSLPLGVRTAMTGHFLQSGVLILFGYLMARRQMPWKALIVGLPALFFLVMPVLSVYKDTAVTDRSARSDGGKDLDVQYTAQRTLQRLSDRGRGHGFELGLHRLLIRNCNADSACRYTWFYPHVYDFEGGKSFVAALAGLIPRVIWPDKPNFSATMDTYAVKIKILRAVGAGTSMNVEAVSEYYLNFGLFGVLLFSILHGVYMKVLHRWLVLRSHYELGAPIYLVLFLTNVEFLGVFQVAVVQSRHLLLWPLMLYVLSRCPRGKAHAA